MSTSGGGPGLGDDVLCADVLSDDERTCGSAASELDIAKPGMTASAVANVSTCRRDRMT
jgi:hypothetical protein